MMIISFAAQNKYDFNNEDDDDYEDDDNDDDDCVDDEDAENDLILRTAIVSASAAFDCWHGDVDGVHVTLWL